jgi:hypothetical protein
MNDIQQQIENLERRMARIESRLVQLMIHLGADPYEKKYEDTYHR